MTPFSFPFQRSRAHRISLTMTRAGFDAIRKVENQSVYGVDVPASTRNASQIHTPQRPEDVDEALDRLENFKQAKMNPLVPDVGVGVEFDSLQGEPAIGMDRAAWEAIKAVCDAEGVAIFGEEDKYRDQPDGAKRRAEALVRALKNRMPFAIVDPLDGSNQAAAMGIRSGYAVCVLLSIPGEPTIVLILLGDGRSYLADGRSAWIADESGSERMFRKLPDEPNPRGFERPHFIIPTAKRSTIALTFSMTRVNQGFEHVSPLAGNPGLLAGLISGGSIAGVQPAAYAWDHLAAHVLATAGYYVLAESGTSGLAPDDVLELLLTDMVNGRKTEAIYTGRTELSARSLRKAVLEGKVYLGGIDDDALREKVGQHDFELLRSWVLPPGHEVRLTPDGSFEISDGELKETATGDDGVPR